MYLKAANIVNIFILLDFLQYISVVYQPESGKPFGMKHESCDPWIPIFDQSSSGFLTTKDYSATASYEECEEALSQPPNVKFDVDGMMDIIPADHILAHPETAETDPYTVLNSPVTLNAPPADPAPSSGINPSDGLSEVSFL